MNNITAKTNAVRLLDKAGIAYELISYKVNEEDLSAVHVAEQLGADVKTIFKTLVLRGDRSRVFVCVIPGDAEVDLKAAAKVSSNKNADLIPTKKLLLLTGYIRGGCSPIGMKKRYPSYIDDSCLTMPAICVSAGVRGLQIRLAPADLVAFIDAGIEPLTRR